MFEINRKDFGAFVAQLRKEKGLTQKALADRLYISDKAISKWETGVSIPDTALLVPLAEILGVSVTELLMCRRIPPKPMDTAAVETLVKTAIAYPQPRQSRRQYLLPYLLSVALGFGGLMLMEGQPSESAAVSLVLGVVFGAYFCFFAQRELPAYYDKNRIHTLSDGFFRMNIPGIRFTNRNWPYILRVGRWWSHVFTAAVPLLCAALYRLEVPHRLRWEQGILLTAALGGLFLPLYWVGKKYE